MDKVKKVQVSIPEEHYEGIEKRWKSYGYPSLATAAKVLLMGNTAEHVRELRRIESNVEKAKELYAKNEQAKKEVQQPKNERPKTLKKRNGKTVVKAPKFSRSNPQVEAWLKSQLDNGYIDKERYDKAKGLSQLIYEDDTHTNVVWE